MPAPICSVSNVDATICQLSATLQGVYHGIFPSQCPTQEQSCVWVLSRPHNWRPVDATERLILVNTANGKGLDQRPLGSRRSSGLSNNPLLFLPLCSWRFCFPQQNFAPTVAMCSWRSLCFKCADVSLLHAGLRMMLLQQAGELSLPALATVPFLNYSCHHWRL